MPVYRYAYLSDGPDGANRLLAQGWRPVRETAGNQQVLVLLERDESPALGSLELLDGIPNRRDADCPPRREFLGHNPAARGKPTS